MADPTAEDLVEVVRSVTGPGAYGSPAAADALFDCAGVPQVLVGRVTSGALRRDRSVVGALRGAPRTHGTQLVRKAIKMKGSFGYGDSFPERGGQGGRDREVRGGSRHATIWPRAHD